MFSFLILSNFLNIGKNCCELRSEKREVLLVSFSDFAHFVFAIIYCFLLTDESLTSFARKVPDLGVYFSGQFVDFTKDINHQLCELIGLTDDEILYIDKRINDIDTKRNK